MSCDGVTESNIPLNEASSERVPTPDRDQLLEFVENSLRSKKGGEYIFCSLVAKGLSPEEADRMVRGMSEGPRLDFVQAVETEKKRIAHSRRSPLWPCLLGGTTLAIGIGAWVGTYTAAKNGGTYFIPYMAIIFGFLALAAGVQRIIARFRG